MDTLTHALSGALVALATAPARAEPGILPLRTRVAAGFAAAAFPDADFVLRLFDTLLYLNWHQGVTHSPLLLPAWAFVLAHLFSRLDPGRHSWRAFYGTACMGIAIHIASDVITAYGLMLFAPLSSERFSLPLAFVIDPWFTAIIVGGLVGAALLPRGRAIAWVALIALLGYVGFLAAQQQRALAAGEAHVARHALTGTEIHALPQPLSPFNWKIIITEDDRYHVARTNVSGERRLWPPFSMIDALKTMHEAYQPVARIDWHQVERFGHPPSAAFAREAWQQPAFSGFRRFAEFPSLERIDAEEEGRDRCAWFMDLRFDLPAIPPSFRFAMCQDERGDWQMRRADGAFFID
jgi:inner membrane protein